jgi:aminoglycoside phosphotransferase family enzyme
VTRADAHPEPPSQERIVAWLSTPVAYAGDVRAVERVETHFAWVFLTGARAYKLKKSIRIHGADLRLLAVREHFCREELRLNRRLAAPTYLAVQPVADGNAGLSIGGPGRVVDWLVEMRELDRSLMLDRRLRADDAGPQALRQAVAHLHRLDVPGTATPAAPRELLDGVHARAAEALAEIARPEFAVPPALCNSFAAALRARLHEAEPLLAARAGRLRDGHGDLRAEHVWLGEPLQIIDALEFDPALRRLEAAEDVAMLAVDTERLAGPWTRRELCAAHEELAADPVPDAVWQVYLGLRAAMRAKVALWHLDDAHYAADPDRWRCRAFECLALGAARLESPPRS